MQICGNRRRIFVGLKLKAQALTREGGTLLLPLCQGQPGQTGINLQNLTTAVNEFLHKPPREKEPARFGPAFR